MSVIAPMLKNHTVPDGPKWLALPAEAQLVYFHMAWVNNPRRCGIVDFFPRRYARMAKELTEDSVVRAVQDLESAGLLTYDETTEEVFLHGYIKQTMAANNSRMVVAVVNSFEGVLSDKLLDMARDEMAEIFGAGPKHPVWADERVRKAMHRSAKAGS